MFLFRGSKLAIFQRRSQGNNVVNLDSRKAGFKIVFNPGKKPHSAVMNYPHTHTTQASQSQPCVTGVSEIYVYTVQRTGIRWTDIQGRRKRGSGMNLSRSLSRTLTERSR
jgi:hypothetical protein